MNRQIEQYFDLVESLLLGSPAVTTYEITRKMAGTNDGKIRIKATLADGGLAEFFEYVVATPYIRVVKYSFHCQDAAGQLLKRWDNAPHFPQFPNSPHHIHLADGEVIAACQPAKIATVLSELEDFPNHD
ncbi:MAG: DUF6516 family protein [Desulfurivibrio sp.]|nr:DUF6516 family protein [Desulfurivibrio sp.]